MRTRVRIVGAYWYETANMWTLCGQVSVYWPHSGFILYASCLHRDRMRTIWVHYADNTRTPVRIVYAYWLSHTNVWPLSGQVSAQWMHSVRRLSTLRQNADIMRTLCGQNEYFVRTVWRQNAYSMRTEWVQYADSMGTVCRQNGDRMRTICG